MAFRLSRRMFVGNIPWTIGQREFFEYFSQFGPVVSHIVIFDKTTGLSKKHGFIQYGNEDSMRDCLKQKTHYLEGNRLEILEQTESNTQRKRF